MVCWFEIFWPPMLSLLPSNELSGICEHLRFHCCKRCSIDQLQLEEEIFALLISSPGEKWMPCVVSFRENAIIYLRTWYVHQKTQLGFLSIINAMVAMMFSKSEEEIIKIMWQTKKFLFWLTFYSSCDLAISVFILHRGGLFSWSSVKLSSILTEKMKYSKFMWP